jgi:hypothetical protein
LTDLKLPDWARRRAKDALTVALIERVKVAAPQKRVLKNPTVSM